MFSLVPEDWNLSELLYYVCWVKGEGTLHQDVFIKNPYWERIVVELGGF